MEIPSYFAALKRQFLIVLVGLVCAAGLAVFSAYRVEDGGLVARQPAVYQASTRIIVGAPNRSLFGATGSEDTSSSATRPYSPQELAEIYPYLIVGDDVQSAVEQALGRKLRSPERITASRPLGQPENRVRDGVIQPSQSVIPVVEISATASDSAIAARLTDITANTFIDYVDAQQSLAGIPSEGRAKLSVLEAARTGSRVDSGPLGGQILIFLGVLAGFLVLAFVRDGIQRYRTEARRREFAEEIDVQPASREIAQWGRRRRTATPPRVDREDREPLRTVSPRDFVSGHGADHARHAVANEQALTAERAPQTGLHGG